jgi:hypothetical protein
MERALGGSQGGETVAQFGRTAAPPGTIAQSRLAKRSVILALVAFAAGAIAVATMVALPSDASALAQNVATAFFMAIFLLVAPVMHIAGVICGLMALGRSNDNRLLGLVGIILNGVSVAAGLLVLWAMISTMGAFT